jgi:dihydrofolate synthase/folylpolyglutamate synthase
MYIKDFESAREYLESLIPYKMEDYEKIGLGRMEALLKEMGDPHRQYSTIHVGGTAGKGSVATMISKITESAGFKTGLHISPHLQDIRERMQVNGKMMKEKEFIALVVAVRNAVEKVEKSRHGKPSYFEAMLAMSFHHFMMEGVDVAVIEVGLGGRLDGTNVVAPEVVVLTNVGLDHMEFLGDTVEEIAHEKVGIFKKGVDVVSGVTQPSVIEIVQKRAKELGCKLFLLGKDISYDRVKMRKAGSMFDLVVGDERYHDVELSMMGTHQVSNAALAVGAALRLNHNGLIIKEEAFRKALANVSVPGRFEIERQGPLVVMDGAHNPMKTDALVRTIEECYPKRKVFFVFGSMKTKNVKEMIAKLSPVAAKFYFTSFQSTTDFGKRMSYDPQELKYFTEVESEVIKDSSKAYEKAIKDAGPRGIICVTGSFYLVGELRGRLI